VPNLTWLRFLRPSALDAFRIISVNRKLMKRFDLWETHSAYHNVRKLSEEDLKKYIESEWIRAKELDDKLSKLTATLSIALTVGGAVAKTVVDGLASSLPRTLILATLFMSMIFFLYGAIIGFRGLRPKPRYGYGSAYMVLIAQGGDGARREMEKAACGFETVNLVRANEASLAINLIRNGVLFFAIGIAASFFAPSKEAEENSPPKMIYVFNQTWEPKAPLLQRWQTPFTAHRLE
jgi:hypothetical protein